MASVLSLSFWRMRRTSLALSLNFLGLLTTIIIACSFPLFSTVTTTAGLRSILRASPTSAELDVHAETTTLAPTVFQALNTNLQTTVQHFAEPYLSKEIRRSITSYDFSFFHAPFQPGVAQNPQVDIYATSLPQVASHLHLLQGRLPQQSVNGELEVILTPRTAQGLGVHVNSEIPLLFPLYIDLPPSRPQLVTLQARVVGIFNVSEGSAAYWHDEDFEPQTGVQTTYTFFASDSALFSFYALLSSRYHFISTSPYDLDTIDWYYSVNPLSVNATQLEFFADNLARLQATISQKSNSPGAGFPYSYLSRIGLFSSLLNTTNHLGTLERFQESVNAARIPVFVLTLEIVALSLLFISMMTDLLIEGQGDVIAVLRSRGASRHQIFSSLLLQSASICLLALVIGVLLAPSVVLIGVQHTLLPGQQDATDVVTQSLLHASLSVIGYALLVVCVALLTMTVSSLRAMRMDALSLRRESARSFHVSLWQRFHLDIFFGVIALAGYLLTLYLTSIGNLLNGNTKATIAVPLALIAPLFLVVAVLLLLLRFFPRLIEIGAWLAANRGSVTSLLALAQLARSPRQFLRTVLLLALTLSFTCFSLILTASQQQHAVEVVDYETGADFGGVIPTHLYHLSPRQQIAPYLALSGVLAASAGYSASGIVGDVNTIARTVQIRAVDTSTFAHTVIWPVDASAQSPDALMNLLSSYRSYGVRHNVVPVIVDSSTLQEFSLHTGSIFHIEVDTMLVHEINYFVIGSMTYIPAGYDNTLSGTSENAAQGGVLADFPTYQQVYAQNVKQFLGKGEDELPLNYLWLHTKSDSRSLAEVRVALNTLALHLDALQDRRMLLENALTDPLFITLHTVLVIGLVAILLLAISGNFFASWLSIRKRLTQVAVLRALGLSMREVTAMLLWEQGCIYGIGLLLGIAFGMVISFTVVPILISNTRNANLSEAAFSVLQNTLPIHLVFPISLGIAFVVLLFLFISLLGVMIYFISHITLRTSLRINED